MASCNFNKLSDKFLCFLQTIHFADKDSRNVVVFLVGVWNELETSHVELTVVMKPYTGI